MHKYSVYNIVRIVLLDRIQIVVYVTSKHTHEYVYCMCVNTI